VRRTALWLSAGCVAVSVAGCGGSSKAAGPTATTGGPPTKVTATVTTAVKRPVPPSPAAIQRAAQRTGNKPGYRAAVVAEISVPEFNGNHMTAVGNGTFDPKTHSGTLNVAVTLPGLLGLIGPLPTQVLIVGSDVYVRVPSELATEEPSLKPWLEVSLSELGLDDLLSPADILREVARDATSTVKDQSAQVTLDPRTGDVRTVTLSYSQPSPRARVRVVLRLTGFGPQPATVAPPPDQVGDLASALQDLGF
jgi:hypothetical protein